MSGSVIAARAIFIFAAAVSLPPLSFHAAPHNRGLRAGPTLMTGSLPRLASKSGLSQQLRSDSLA